MGEILGSFFAGFLEGILRSIFEDLTPSFRGALTMLALGGKQRSDLMIRYAEETGGPDGLIRESNRRKRVSFILGVLIFILFFELFFWMIALLASYSKDLEWFRTYGFRLFAGTAAVFLSVILVSRMLAAGRAGRVSLSDDKLPPKEFAVPGAWNSTGKDLMFAFGILFGVFFVLLMVYTFTVRSSPALLIIDTLLFCASAGLITLALAERPRVIPIMRLTQDGIYKGLDATISKPILWKDVQDLSVWKGCLKILPGRSADAENSGTPQDPVIIGLDHSLLSAEILLYKCGQYRNMVK